MDDLMGKIQAMLSDEESMNQIKQLAEMLGASNTEENPQKENASPAQPLQMFSGENSNSSENNGFGFDMGMLLKLQGLMQSVSSNDSNTELLLALKPHLRKEKQERVDRAVKLLKLFALWTVIKESGLLKSVDLF